MINNQYIRYVDENKNLYQINPEQIAFAYTQPRIINFTNPDLVKSFYNFLDKNKEIEKKYEYLDSSFYNSTNLINKLNEMSGEEFAIIDRVVGILLNKNEIVEYFKFLDKYETFNTSFYVINPSNFNYIHANVNNYAFSWNF